MLDKLIAVK